MKYVLRCGLSEREANSLERLQHYDMPVHEVLIDALLCIRRIGCLQIGHASGLLVQFHNSGFRIAQCGELTPRLIHARLERQFAPC